MRKSLLNIYNALSEQSLAVPGLVTQLSKKDSRFFSEFEAWLLKTEDILKKNGLPDCSEIAGLRSKIIESMLSTDVTRSKRKIRWHTSSSIVYDAQRVVLEVISPLREKIEESRVLIRQLLGVAYQTKMISKDVPFNDLIKGLWEAFKQNDQLRSYTTRISSSVGHTDALRILAEEIDLTQ
jgi:hypothetical protein